MKLRLASALLIVCTLAGCTDWERTTFQTLSASKATIDQAQADYESHSIPKTAAVKKAIEEAKAVQTTAVEGLLTYEKIKDAKGTQTALQAQQAIVVAALTQLPALLAAIKAASSVATATTDTYLYGAPGTTINPAVYLGPAKPINPSLFHAAK